MQRNLTNLSKIQTQMSSMKNFSKPSDDPINVQRAMQLQTSIDYNAQYAVNIKATQGWMQTTDTALVQLSTVLTNIRNNLEKGGGDGGYTQDERDKINDEVNQEVSQVAQLLNTNFKGEYVFGGTAGLSKPVSTSNYDITRTVVSDGFDISGWKTGTVTFNIMNSNGTTIDKTITLDTKDSSGNPPDTIDDVIKNLNAKIQSDTDFKDKINVVKTDDGNIKFLAVDSSETIKIDSTGISNLSGVNGQQLSSTDDYKNCVRIDYSDKDGNTLNYLPDVVSNGFNPSNWNDKKIDFTIKVPDPSNPPDGTMDKTVEISTMAITENTNIDDVVKDLNTKVQESDPDFKDKVNVVKTNDGNIKFLAIDSSDTIKIKSTEIGDMNIPVDGQQLSSMALENIGASKNIEVSQGVVLDYNATAVDVMKYGSGDNDDIRLLMDRIEHHMAGQVQSYTDTDGNKVTKDTKNAILGADGNYYIWKNDQEEATKQLTNQDLIDIDAASKQVLKVDSQIGAKEKRMDGLSDQNSSAKVDMTDILSKTEDIDISEKTIEYATMITIYQACLQTGARIMQPTLMDYIS